MRTYRILVPLCLTLALLPACAGAPGEQGGATAAAEPAAAGEILVVLNKSDHTASLLEPDSGRELAVLPTGRGPHEVAVSPDGRTAVVADYGERGGPGSTLTVLDLVAREVVKTIDLGGPSMPHGLAFFPDGTRLAVTAERRKALLIVDPVAGKVVRELPTGQEVSHMVALSPDASRAFVANIGSGSVSVLDLESGEARIVATGEGAEGIAVTPDGRELWVTNRGADTVSVLDAKSLETLATVPAASFPIRVAITPDGRRALVSCARSGDLAVIDVAARREVARISMALTAGDDAEERLFGDRFGDSPVPVGVLVRPDGRLAYVANTNADAISVVDLERGEVVRRLSAGREPDGMAWAALP